MGDVEKKDEVRGTEGSGLARESVPGAKSTSGYGRRPDAVRQPIKNSGRPPCLAHHPLLRHACRAAGRLWRPARGSRLSKREFAAGPPQTCRSQTSAVRTGRTHSTCSAPGASPGVILMVWMCVWCAAIRDSHLFRGVLGPCCKMAFPRGAAVALQGRPDPEADRSDR